MNLSFKFPSVYRQFQGDQAELNVRLGLCILFYLRLYVCMHILPCLFICTGYGVYIWYAHSFSQNLSEDIKIDRPVTFTLSIQLTVPIPHPGAQYFTNTLLFITAVSQEWEHNNLSGLEIKLSMGTEYQKDTSVKKKYMYKYSDKCFINYFIHINKYASDIAHFNSVYMKYKKPNASVFWLLTCKSTEGQWVHYYMTVYTLLSLLQPSELYRLSSCRIRQDVFTTYAGLFTVILGFRLKITLTL